MKFLPTLGGSMSGSLGGITASHNRGGQYFRRRSVPTNPNSTRQQDVRSIFGSINQTWGTLTDAQRQAWRDYAAATPITNPLGQSVVLTGNQAFVRANTARLQSAVGSVQIAAPTILDTGVPAVDVTEFSVDSGDTTYTLSVTFGDVIPAVAYMLVYIGRAISAGSQFFKGPYQLAYVSGDQNSNTDTTEEITIATDWLSETVPLDADVGRLYPLRIVMVYGDGRVSQDYRVVWPLTETSV